MLKSKAQKTKKSTIWTWLIVSTSLLGVSAITGITLTSCGISKDITSNLVGRGDYSKYSDDISFNDAIQMAATSKTASTAFKDAVANEIAYQWYHNAADGTYSNTNTSHFKDNLKQWSKQIDKDYDAKVKEYKSNHKYDWQYYFQNEVLDPVGGTKALWKKYDAQKGMCQYIYRDMIDLTKNSGSYLGISTNASNANFTYNWLDGVSTYSGLSDDSAHTNIQSNGILTPLNWNKIEFYVKASGNSSPQTQRKLDQFYVALQREGFYEWLDRNRPISTFDAVWKYSVGDSRKIDAIYNTSESSPTYAFPYFDDSQSSSGSLSANEKFAKLLDATSGDGFTSATDKTSWNSSGFSDTDNSLGLVNISTNRTDNDGTTMSLITKDGYSSTSEFFGPSMLSLFNWNGANSIYDDTTTNFQSLRSSFQGETKPRILANFLFSTSSNQTTLPTQDLTTWYGQYTTPAISKIYKLYTTDQFVENPISKYDLTTNAFQLSDLSGSNNKLPYVIYRGDDGVHIAGIDGWNYLSKADTTAMIDKTNNPNWSTSPKTQMRENAILKYRTLYEQLTTQPTAGSGLKIADAYKSYIDSNFADILINTYYRTGIDHASDANYVPWWGNSSDTDTDLSTDSGDNGWCKGWHLNFPNIGNITKYILDVNRLYDWQDIVSKYDDANKKMINFGSKYAQNLASDNPDEIKKNGLALALPWTQISGGVETTWSGTTPDFYASLANIKTQHARFGATSSSDGVNDFLLSRIGSSSDFSIQDVGLIGLETNVKTSFNDFLTGLGTNNQPTANKSKNGSMKYSEHILALVKDPTTDLIGNNKDVDPIHFVANSLWAIISDSSSKISNIQRADIFDKYLGAKTDGKYAVENDFNDQIVSQFVSSKLMLDDSSLPSYISSLASATYDNYKKLLVDRWQAKTYFAQGWADTTSNEYIDYLHFLATLKYLSTNADGSEDYTQFMKYLQNRSGLRANQPSNMLDNPVVIAWLDNDNYYVNDDSDSSHLANSFVWKTNYNAQYDGRYNHNGVADGHDENGNSTAQRSYETKDSFKQYWQYASLPINGNTSANLSGMGFLGLQSKGNLSGLSDEIANEVFDNYQYGTGSSSNSNFNGSLYRFGDNAAAVADNIKKLGGNDFNGLTSDMIKKLSDLFDKTLPSTLKDESGGTNWQGCKNYINTQCETISDKNQELKLFLFGDGSDSKGALNTWTTDADSHNATIAALSSKPFNIRGADGTTAASAPGSCYVYNDVAHNNNFGTDRIQSRARVMQINYTDVNDTVDASGAVTTTAWDNLKAAVGEDVARALLVQAAIQTSNFDRSLITQIKSSVLDNKDLQVYDRRLNDDADLRDWLGGNYKPTN